LIGFLACGGLFEVDIMVYRNVYIAIPILWLYISPNLLANKNTEDGEMGVAGHPL
jgi:hypothetical protein